MRIKPPCMSAGACSAKLIERRASRTMYGGADFEP
jgi:hypothetical protein